MPALTIALIIALAFSFYHISRIRAIATGNGNQTQLHSRPIYHGLYSFLWVVLPGIAVLLIGSFTLGDNPFLLAATLGVAAIGGIWSLRGVTVDTRARNKTEKIIIGLLWGCAGIAVLTTIGIVLSLIFETVSFFDNIGWRIDKFLFGARWSPL